MNPKMYTKFLGKQRGKNKYYYQVTTNILAASIFLGFNSFGIPISVALCDVICNMYIPVYLCMHIQL